MTGTRSTSRTDVFHKSLIQANITVTDDHLVRCKPDIQGAHKAAKEMIAGFANITLGQYLPQALTTTVHIQSQQIGTFAAEMLFARLTNPDQEQLCRQVDSHLVVRETTAVVHTAPRP